MRSTSKSWNYTLPYLLGRMHERSAGFGRIDAGAFWAVYMVVYIVYADPRVWAWC